MTKKNLNKNDYILEMNNITKRFGGVKALDNVNLKVRRDTIHGLCGENGAGKSTLMNVLSGLFPQGHYEGELIFDGELVNFSNIKDSEKNGISIIHQELSLVPNLNIMENIFLGSEISKNGVINWKEQEKVTKKYLTLVGLEEDPYEPINNLSVAKKQLIELAKAISKNIKLLILDEPTASLNENDSQKLLEIIESLTHEGITSIIISHKLDEIVQVADDITIIRDGKTIETLNNNDKNIDQDRIIQGMIGRKMTSRYPDKNHKAGDKYFELSNWTFSDKKGEIDLLKDININVSESEIVGIYGLMGSGRSELALSIYGYNIGNKISGTMIKNKKELDINSVKEAINNGIVYLTEDRKSLGLFLDDSIKKNISIASLDKISSNNVINEDKEIRIAEELSEKVNVKSSGINQNTRYLSGGNQQKVLLARLFCTDADLFILDEPTKGVDVGAKYEIYKLINEYAEKGKSIIVISSELPEVIGISDRIYVMNDGQIVGEFDQKDATQENIFKSIIDHSENTIVSHSKK